MLPRYSHRIHTRPVWQNATSARRDSSRSSRSIVTSSWPHGPWPQTSRVDFRQFCEGTMLVKSAGMRRKPQRQLSCPPYSCTFIRSGTHQAPQLDTGPGPCRSGCDSCAESLTDPRHGQRIRAHLVPFHDQKSRPAESAAPRTGSCTWSASPLRPRYLFLF